MTPRQQQGTEESLLREPGTAERGAAPPKEALLAGIVESSADAIIGWTLGGTIFSWNVGAEKLLGYFIAEAVGEYIGIIVPPERQVEIESLRHRTEADETLEGYETVLVKKDGTRVDVSLTVSPARDQMGEIIGASTIARDITRTKWAEINSRTSEIRYRRLFETAKDGILLLAAETAQIIDVNPFLIKLLGYSHDEFLGKKLWDIGLVRDVEACRAGFQELQEKEYIRYENLPLVTREGQTIEVEFVSNLYSVPGGKVIQCNVRDITGRRQAERDLNASEARYRRLFETATDGILLLDAESGEITDVNPFLVELLGYSRDQCLGKKLWNIGLFKDVEARKIAFRELPEKESIHCEDLPLQSADGRRVDVEFVSKVYWAGDKKFVQCNIRDISRRKRAEEALRSLNEELEQRVADRTRELREKSESMEAELKIAHELQLAMLPHYFPCFPPDALPSESALRFFSVYNPTGLVSGDFFDVIALSDTAAGLFICDVMGHDVCAALVTAMMRALLEELGPQAHDPAQLLTQLNRVLRNIFRKSHSDMFASAFYLVVDVARSQMSYANAGHPSPLHLRRRNGEVAPIVSNGSLGPALGLFEEATYESCLSSIAPGDLVIMFTDGLLEVKGPDEQYYSQERLLAAVRKHLEVRPPRLFTELLAETREFSTRKEFDDDVCLLGMEVAQHRRDTI
jgi:PAS domain S-box-containing protein